MKISIMENLDRQDLNWAIRRLPENLRGVMQSKEWLGNIFIGGGYIRCIINGDIINDVDVFVKSEKEAELLALKLAKYKKDVYKTENAFTVKGSIPIQIIHRWVFDNKEDVSNSFDFTICCAAISCVANKKSENKYSWESYCDKRFYLDLAAKRLVYRFPVRNEDAGGSLLRVLKYYQKGYRIPLDSLGGVIARLIGSVDNTRIDTKNEKDVAFVLSGLLRVVDPQIDPEHEAHLPSSNEEGE